MSQLASLLPEPCVIAIDGPLGAGKTVFAQGLGQGLGIKEPIVSPTFTIANQYIGNNPLLHIDLYRIDAHELEPLGLEEEIEMWDGAVLIEWANKHPNVLPLHYLQINIEIDPNDPLHRNLTVQCIGNTEPILSNWKSKWLHSNG